MKWQLSKILELSDTVIPWFHLHHRNRRVKNYLADSFRTGEIYLPTRSDRWQKGDRGMRKKAGSSPWSIRERLSEPVELLFTMSFGSCSPLWGYTSLGARCIEKKTLKIPWDISFSSYSPSLPTFRLSSFFHSVFTLLPNGSISGCEKVGRESHYHSLQMKICFVLESLFLAQATKLKEFFVLSDENRILTESVPCEFWLYLGILVWGFPVWSGSTFISWYRKFRGIFLR